MAYSHFTTLRSVRQQFGVQTQNALLFPEVEPLEPSAWLRQKIDNAIQHKVAFVSEKSRSEALVFPILSELQERHEFRFGLYSGAALDADKEKGLNGECDFILSSAAQSFELNAPIFCIVEAKDNDLELGIPQCMAQMLGARLFNQQDHLETPIIYGGVTTGEDWQLIRLEENTAFLDTERYYLNQLPELLGVLDAVVRRFL
jgi:hypothetical protein